jgi:phosphoribosyl 1,2-cyclic phosphodiesterase
VSVEAPGDPPIVFDLGTGLRFWGQTLPLDGSFHGIALVTHLHWDHVQGLPFFAPVLCPGGRLDVYAPPQEGCSVAEAFEEFMRPPYFPVRAGDLRGEVRFHDASDGELDLGHAHVTVRSVPHVGATNGYRVQIGSVVVAYISDHQQPMDGSHTVADPVLELCEGADLLIHDAQYRPEEFAEKAHWGHCTVDYAVEVARAAGVHRLALFHHDPSHGDDAIDDIVDHARKLAVGTGVDEVLAAHEGLAVALGGRGGASG